MVQTAKQTNEQSHEHRDVSQSRAVAFKNSFRESNAVSLQAPVQLKLELGRSYYAKKADTIYTTKSGKTQKGETQPEQLYSALEYYMNSRTKIKQHSDETEGWIKTRSDNEDNEFYRIHAPKLAEIEVPEDPSLNQDDVSALISGNISMVNFPNLVTMPNSPSPSDVEQGDLGDCALFSSMASTVQSPYFRKKLKEKYDDKEKVKKVKLHDRQEPKRRKEIGEFGSFIPEQNESPSTIDVETSFPYLQAANSDKHKKDHLLYGQSDPKVLKNIRDNVPQPLWPSVIESAMAQKLGGAYGNLDDKEAEDMTSMLTGRQPIIYELDDITTHWLEIKGILENEGVIVATTKKELVDNKFSVNHAYSVISMTDNSVNLYDPGGKILNDIPMEDIKTYFQKFSVTTKPD